MKEFKGTRGVWGFKEFNSHILKYRFHIFSNNGGNVCKIVRDDNDNCLEEFSNAKLIAAAPEMLEMLQECLAHFNKVKYLLNGVPLPLIEDTEKLLTKILD